MLVKVCEVRFSLWQRLCLLLGAKVTIYADGPTNPNLPNIRLKVQDFLDLF